MIFGIFGRRHLFDFDCGVNNAEYQNGCSDVERIDDGIGNDPLRRSIADAYPCKYEGKQVAHQAAGVAQETLNRIGKSFLFLVHHIAHHHFERLHRHVDRGV